MSLYNIETRPGLPVIPEPQGLSIKECTNLDLLSFMGSTSPGMVRKRLANDHVALGN